MGVPMLKKFLIAPFAALQVAAGVSGQPDRFAAAHRPSQLDHPHPPGDFLRRDQLPLPRRIVVVGTSGSGKTTLAREVARRLALPHVEIDALHWGPNWTEPPVELFRQRAVRAIGGITQAEVFVDLK